MRAEVPVQTFPCPPCRGQLCSLPATGQALGVLLSYSCGLGLPWHHLAWSGSMSRGSIISPLQGLHLSPYAPHAVTALPARHTLTSGQVKQLTKIYLQHIRIFLWLSQSLINSKLLPNLTISHILSNGRKGRKEAAAKSLAWFRAKRPEVGSQNV